MNKVYISGPMSGIEFFNRPMFMKAEEHILGCGMVPLNPAILPDGLSQAQYMDIDLAMLRCADEIMLLPGWEKSLGAKAELALAEKLGLDVSYFSTNS